MKDARIIKNGDLSDISNEDIVLIKGDCLEVLDKLKNLDIKADLFVLDLPYGTTNCKWDVIIPFERMWEGIKATRKERTPTLMFAQTPFDKVLGVSNLKELKYEWIWEKTQATGFLNAKKMPMKAHENILAFHEAEDDDIHENILMFYKKIGAYNPQMTTGHSPVNSYTKRVDIQNKSEVYGKTKVEVSGGGSTTRYPRSVLKFASDKQKEAYHSTQKPVDLIVYLIETYSNKGDLIIDFTAGSFTTAIACIRTNRRFIGVELDEKIFEIGKNRVLEYIQENKK